MRRTDVLSVRSLHSSRITTPWGKPSNLWTFWVYPLSDIFVEVDFPGILFSAAGRDSFDGDSFVFPLVTWVHPSSIFLLGWSSIVFIIGTVVFSVVVAVVVVLMVGEVVVVVVVIVVVVVVFWGQDLEKCPSCLQDQQWSPGYGDYRHRLISAFYTVWNGVTPSPIEAHESRVIVCRLARRCYLGDLFNANIYAQVGSYNVST